MSLATLSHSAEDHSILSSDGKSQIYIKHFSRGKPRIHFLIVHGALEHSGRHQDLVDFWMKCFNDDMAITTFDHVGHGRSGGPRVYVPSFKVYVDDLQKVGEFVQSKNHEHTRTIVCAHSLGGLITLTRILHPDYGWELPLNGLIFSSPCIRPRLILGNTSEPILKRLDLLTPKLHLPMVYSGVDLTHDPARANDFDTDDMIPRFMCVRMAREVVEAGHMMKGLSYYLKIPSLFLVAGSDKIVESESTLLFIQGIDKNLVQVKHYPELYHELWNETERFEIFNTMKKWVEKLLKEKK